MHWLWSYSLQCKYDCISVIWVPNSDFSKTPITPHESCHVLVMSREHNGLIFDAALVGKWLHIWNVCSAICSTKMSVSWWVLVRFWVFKNPYESSCVLPCPEHVLPCPGHVLGMFKSCQRHLATRFWCIFFSIFFNFFQFFQEKSWTPPMFRPFYINFINDFSYFGDKTPPEAVPTWNFDTWNFAIYDWNMT